MKGSGACGRSRARPATRATAVPVAAPRAAGIATSTRMRSATSERRAPNALRRPNVRRWRDVVANALTDTSRTPSSRAVAVTVRRYSPSSPDTAARTSASARDVSTVAPSTPAAASSDRTRDSTPCRSRGWRAVTVRRVSPSLVTCGSSAARGRRTTGSRKPREAGRSTAPITSTSAPSSAARVPTPWTKPAVADVRAEATPAREPVASAGRSPETPSVPYAVRAAMAGPPGFASGRASVIGPRPRTCSTSPVCSSAATNEVGSGWSGPARTIRVRVPATSIWPSTRSSAEADSPTSSRTPATRAATNRAVVQVPTRCARAARAASARTASGDAIRPPAPRRRTAR